MTKGRFAPAFKKRLAELFRKPLENKKQKDSKTAAALSTQIERLKERKSKLFDLFTLDEIDKTALVAKQREYDTEINNLQNQKNVLELNAAGVYEKIMEAVEMLRTLPENYLKQTDPQAKIEILKTMASGLNLKTDGSISIQWRKPYSILMRPEMEEAIEKNDVQLLIKKVNPAEFNDLKSAQVDTQISPVEQIILGFKYWASA